MKKRTKKGHKMENTWFGPYKVLRMFNTGSCSLNNEDWDRSQTKSEC